MEENKNKWTNKFRELGKNKGSTSDFRELYKDMKNNKEGENKNKTPHRMSRIAFPKAKYGAFLAVVLVLLVLIILYKDLIL